jgi:hypothetical protein
VDLLLSPQQIHDILTCRDVVDLLYSCTTSCTANPQQIEQVEFEFNTAAYTNSEHVTNTRTCRLQPLFDGSSEKQMELRLLAGDLCQR